MIRRGDIYFIEFPYDNPFSPERGWHPALVISNDFNNCYARTITVIPITSTLSDKPYHIRVNGCGLMEESEVMCEKLTTIPANLLNKERKIGSITSKGKMDQILNAVIKQLS